MGEISGTAAMRFVEAQGALEEGTLQLEHVRAKRGELVGELLEQGFVQVSHGGKANPGYGGGNRE